MVMVMWNQPDFFKKTKRKIQFFQNLQRKNRNNFAFEVVGEKPGGRWSIYTTDGSGKTLGMWDIKG